MEQLSMFDLMYPTYKIKTPIRLIELFSGVGAQAMALKKIGISFEHYRTCEWETHAIASYKAIHMPDDNTDYSAEMSDLQVGDILFNLGISVDGKKPLTEKQVRSNTYGEAWRRNVYNNIKATRNLVNICTTKGGDLGITDTEHFTYIMTYSFP